MRTTIDLPDDLMRKAKVRAAEDGVRLKELFTRFVEDGLLRVKKQNSRAQSDEVGKRPQEAAGTEDPADSLTRLKTTLPDDRRVRVAGLVESINLSTCLFELALDDGARLQAKWMKDKDAMPPMLGKYIVTEGIVSYNSDGDPVLLLAEAIRLGNASDSSFSRLPVDAGRKARIRLLTPGENPLPRIVGTWPGDETDEEIDAYLTKLS